MLREIFEKILENVNFHEIRWLLQNKEENIEKI